jgi:PAS domain S-box-containing protein
MLSSFYNLPVGFHVSLPLLAFVPHGHCYLWDPRLVWLHGLSNGLTAISYFAIPAALLYFVQQRQDLPYRWMFKLFSAFVGVCGLSHVMEIWTLWHPDYWVSGGIKAFNAILALTTANKLIPLIPEALALPSRTELELAKANLEDLVRDRTQSLRLSEERWQLALQGTNDGIWDWNFQTGEVFFSDRCKEMLGFDADQFMDSPKVWESLIHPDDLPAVTAAFYEHLEDKALFYTLEHRLQCKDGTYKWVLSRGQALRNEAGTVTRMAGSITDITERKHAEAALNESRRQFRNLVENSPDIIERFDLNLRHLYVSPSLTRTTGLSTEVFLGKSCREMGLDETMVNTWEAAANRLLATGEKQVIEFSTPTLEGVRAFEMVIAPEWDEPQAGESGARITSLLCISRDITERKQTEQQLRDLSDRLSLALQSAKLGVWEWDTASNQVIWDNRICEIYGVPPSNHPRSFAEWEAMVHPDDLPYCQAQSWRVLQDPSVNTGGIEFRMVRPDGSVCYVESYFLVQREETGQPDRLVGVNLDITERKRAEEALAASERQLSTLISNLPGYVYRVQNDPNFTPLFISTGVEAVTGYRQDEYLVERSISCGQEIHPDDAEWVWERVQQAVGDRTPYECEYRIRTKTGEERWVWERGRGIYDEAGSLQWLEGFVTDISDRKLAEAELLSQKELLQITLDHLPVMVSVHSETGNILLVNQTIEQTVGWTQAEHLTRDVLRECYPDPADYDRVTRHIAAADATWQEFRLRTRDGRLIDTAWTQIPLPDGRSIGIGQDITERKQAEAARLQTEKLQTELKLLETVLDSVLAGYWDYDLRNGTNYWSPGLKRMLGYAEDEIPHTLDNWERQIWPEDLQTAKACLERHVQSRGAEPYYNEIRYRHKNGSIVWVICAGQGIEWSESGELLRMVGCHVDITPLKHIEAQLRISEGHLQEAQRIGNIGSWEFDVQTEQITWSEQVFHIFRRDLALGTPEDFATFQQLVYPSDREFYAETLQTLMDTHQPYDVEFRICRGDGSIGHVQSKGEAVLDATGRLIKLTGIVLDITERKRVEAKLLQKSAQLEASNRELEAFAYSVSHDLRSPLRAIDGFSRALLEDYGHQFDDEGRDYFNRIRHNVQRMGMLIDDLLSLSRVSRLEMRYATVDLSAIAHELLQELWAAEPERQVECIIAPDVTVWADPSLMRVVLSNLLQNAWKFTSHHSTARIEFGILQQPEQTVYFVRDDGAGFDMAYSAMLFGVFQRLHNMTEFPGTGIGLATVQRIIHRHGGQVWAEAAVEQGATIYFTLPIPVLEARSEARSDL